MRSVWRESTKDGQKWENIYREMERENHGNEERRRRE
jgi:hypothetical protein